jgi:hypothetical protein
VDNVALWAISFSYMKTQGSLLGSRWFMQDSRSLSPQRIQNSSQLEVPCALTVSATMADFAETIHLCPLCLCPSSTRRVYLKRPANGEWHGGRAPEGEATIKVAARPCHSCTELRDMIWRDEVDTNGLSAVEFIIRHWRDWDPPQGE